MYCLQNQFKIHFLKVIYKFLSVFKSHCTGVATCRPCRSGLQLFIESQKNKVPQNAIKLKDNGVRGEHPQVLTKKFHIPSECTIYHPCFHFFMLFQIPSQWMLQLRCLQFEIVYALETLFLKCSLQFKIVSNTTRMHAEETLPLHIAMHIRNSDLIIWYKICALL